jgi:hypothetical protein
MYRRRRIIPICSVIFFLSVAMAAEAQFVPKLSIAGGLGVPELFHAGLNLQTSTRSGVGLYYGFIHASSHKSSGWFHDFELNMRSVTLDHTYQFGKVSTLSHRRPWYTRQGINYYHEVRGSDDTFSGIVTIGRQFPFSDSAGLTLDIGTAIPFSSGKNMIPAARLQIYILLSRPPQGT